MSETKFRDGDIFFWQYKNPPKEYAYWCKSQKAIVRNGLLIDTYWSDNSSERAIDPDRCILEYKGNETELVKIQHHDVWCYEPEDIIDMRHANSPRDFVYVKPTAKRSVKRMIEQLVYERERAECDIRMSQHKIERINAALERVTSGDTAGYFP